MHILFVSATRIGDAVLSTGLLSYLVERHSDARFTIGAGRVAAPLFETVPRLERLIVIDKRRYGLHWLHLYSRVVGRRWDLVVDVRGSALAYLLLARERRVRGKGPREEPRVVQLGRLFGLDPPPAPRLWTSPGHDEAAARLIPTGGPVLAIGPAANWRAKTWRAERFAELARRLTAPVGVLPSARVAVLAAAHERAQAAPLLEAIAPERRIDLVGRTDLLTAAAVLRRCALFVGNDTGLMHMAAAMGVPTVGLFGPSPATHYAPWGPRTAFAQTERTWRSLMSGPDFDYRTSDTLMDGLSVDAAEAAVRGLWKRLAGDAA
jgi:lipopolysaccharide export system permease protein